MYEHQKVLRGFGASINYEELMVPEGVKLSPELTHALSTLPTQMALPVLGTFTPWAKIGSDFTWTSVQDAPESNLRLYLLKPEMLPTTTEKLFNQPLPFVGVVSPNKLTAAEVQKAVEGSDYEYYGAFAVYNQADKSPTPSVLYFYWLSMGPEGQKRTKAMSSVESLLKGQLVLPARVPYADTASRAFPVVTAQQALDTQLTEISRQDMLDYQNPQVAPSTAASGNQGLPLLGMLFLGAAAAAATVFVGKAMRK